MTSCGLLSHTSSNAMTPERSDRAASPRKHLELLFARAAAGERPALTPGDLYRRMSLEFRARRAANHGGCVMPMVVCRPDSALSVNWSLEPLTASCAQCEPIALAIAWRHAERFDVRVLGTAEENEPLQEAA